MKLQEGLSDYQREPIPTQLTQTESSGALPTEAALEAPSQPPKRGELAQKVRRALNQQLRKRGIPEEDLPLQLRDVTVKKSRKGKAGQIVLRALSGVQKTPAAILARKLEHDLSGGREDIIEKLQASPTPHQGVKKVAEILESNPQFSLARAIVEAGADVAHVLDHYAKGALALQKMETVLSLYKEMPRLMRDLMGHAIDKEVTCEVCFGIGKVTTRTGGKELGRECPRCHGSGKNTSTSEHKEFAAAKVLEISELLPKKGGPMVNVNQAVQVNAAGGGSEVLARLSKAADEILYGKNYSSPSPRSSGVIDAEFTEVENG